MIMGTTIKRYSIPKYWNVPKKANVFVVKPMPGPHAKDHCMPLQVLLRNVLKLTSNAKESRNVLNSEKVLVDKKVRKNPKFPVGLMDVVEIPDAKKSYRVMINKHGLYLHEIKDADTAKKLCKITGKKSVCGGMTQVNLHDGRNLLLKKDAYAVGDSLLIQLPDQKVIKHFKLAKGEPATIISGKNMGISGNIEQIKKRKNMLEKSTIMIKTGSKGIETLLSYAMVGEV